MSRIGKNPVSIPQGGDVNINENVVTVTGKLGELTQTISDGITVKIEDGQIVLDKDFVDVLLKQLFQEEVVEVGNLSLKPT